MEAADAANEGRLAQAAELLREAVYRSRAAQAGRGLFAEGRGDLGQCGLGDSAEVVLDLSERAILLAASLWPDGLDGETRARLKEVQTEWIELQDSIDRDRNHHLKRFRLKHGMDRGDWSADVLAEFEQGLSEINQRETDERLRAAERLLRSW